MRSRTLISLRHSGPPPELRVFDNPRAYGRPGRIRAVFTVPWSSQLAKRVQRRSRDPASAREGINEERQRYAEELDVIGRGRPLASTSFNAKGKSSRSP